MYKYTRNDCYCEYVYYGKVWHVLAAVIPFFVLIHRPSKVLFGDEGFTVKSRLQLALSTHISMDGRVDLLWVFVYGMRCILMIIVNDVFWAKVFVCTSTLGMNVIVSMYMMVNVWNVLAAVIPFFVLIHRLINHPFE